MKQTNQGISQSDLTARINRFMDRKIAKTLSISELSSGRTRRTRHQLTEVIDTPYIALTVK